MIQTTRRAWWRPCSAILLTLTMLHTAGHAAVPPAASKFNLYIHAGGQVDSGTAASALAGRLAAAGYHVRGIDKQQDVVGGPAIDYYDESSEGTAASVAAIVNEQLKLGGLPNALKPRRQQVRNPQPALGIWLYPMARN